MVPMSSLIFVLLGFLNVEARVVDDIAQCGGNFYRDTPPVIGSRSPYSLSAICQTYDNVEYFATVYNRTARIPLYSAYQLTSLSCPAKARRSQKWYVEPQLISRSKPASMASMGRIDSQDTRERQASAKDFDNTGYDKGHLNPNAHQCTIAGRNATFTLTNAVPQDPCFNRIYWYEMEKHVFSALKASCQFPGARRYIVTGAGGEIERIPLDTDREVGTDTDDLFRVTAPAYMWSAVCCDSSAAMNQIDMYKGWSFGYYGLNTPVSSVDVYSVQELNMKLSSSGSGGTVQIFTPSGYGADCVFDNDASDAAKEKARRVARSQNMRTLLENEEVARDKDTLKRGRELLDHGYAKITKIEVRSDVDIQFERPDTNNVLDQLGKLDLFCDTRNQDGNSHDNRRELRSVADHVIQCEVENVRYRGDITTQGHLCLEAYQCARRGSSYSWCYTTDNWDYGMCCETACGWNQYTNEFTCSVGSSTEPCAPHMTVDATYTGTLCRDDHKCGTWDTTFTWCYIDDDNNWDYCCNEWHSCGRHGQNYNWCYVDNDQWRWRKCTPPGTR